MYCVPRIFLILCTITLIKAIGLKIDGLLNLGDSWSYEYRILRSGLNDRPNLRAEEDAQVKNNAIAPQRQEEITSSKELQSIFEKQKEIAYQKDEETALEIEKKIAQKREEEVAYHMDNIARQNTEKSKKTAAQIQEEKDHLSLAEGILRNEAKRLRIEAENPKKSIRGGPDVFQIHYIHNKKIPTTVITSTAADRSDSEESDASDKVETMVVHDETTKKSKNILRESRDYSDTRYSSESSDTESHHSSDISASYKDKTRQGRERHDDNSVVNIISIDNYTTPKSLNNTLEPKVNNSILLKKNEIVNPPSTTHATTKKITTVRTGDIFTDAHKVRNDTKIIEFTNHLYKQTLKIFGTIKEKTDQDHLKKQIDDLLKSYQQKFKEFIKDTSQQIIKTRLGTQKVVLNTIDTSNRLLIRLLNFMINDLDKKGILRHNAGTANRFRKAIETEQQMQSTRACKKFGICRIGAGLSAFTVDVLEILLKCDDAKFQQSLNAFSEVVSNVSFGSFFTNTAEEALFKFVLTSIEDVNLEHQRAVLMILKNIITSQNKPMIVNNFSSRSSVVNATLSLLEIIDLLDNHVPRSEANYLEWNDLKRSLNEFASGRRQDVQDIMEAIKKHLEKNFKTLDDSSLNIIHTNVNTIVTFAIDQLHTH